jgi:hypothetical protein
MHFNQYIKDWIRRAVKKFQTFLTPTVWCIVSAYRLDRVLLATSRYKFCRGCAMQLGGSGATGSRDSCFCFMITHRAKHRFLCSNSPGETFLSSSNHRAIRISFCVSSDLYSENGPQGDRCSNHGEHQIECDYWTPIIPQESFRQCFQQWQDRWSKCVCVCVYVYVCMCMRKGPTLKIIR